MRRSVSVSVSVSVDGDRRVALAVTGRSRV
jgi:hypothetical protein